MIEAAANAIDVLAILVLVVGMFLSAVMAAETFRDAEGNWRARLTGVALVTFRITLGRWMLTALEILIVSDVLHSISHRTLEEVAMLAVIVMIRVAMAYFLDLEISRIEGREQQSRLEEEPPATKR